MNLPLSRIVGNTGWAACCASGTLVALFTAMPAEAQLLNQFVPSEIYGTGVEPDVTVTSRSRAAYQSDGIRAGGYIIRPRATESFGYETNVLGRARGSEVGSSLVNTSASIGAASDNSRGNVSGGIGVDDTRYLDLPNQSFTNWNVRLGGTYNIGLDTASVQVSHDNLNQTQRDLDVPQLAAPLPYRLDTIRVGYRAPFSRLSLLPTLEAIRYSYDSGRAGNVFYDQSYRNRVTITPGVVAAYEFATRRSAIIVVRNTTGLYSNSGNSSTFGPKRDFNDTSVLGGIDYDLNCFLRLRALVGYETRSFSSSAYQVIQAPIAELSLIYSPTGVTTLTGTLSRRIQDSADETTAAATTLAARVQLDYELKRNVILTATANAARNDYAVGGSQSQYGGSLSGTYLVNRFAAVSGNYSLIARTTSNPNVLNLNGFGAGNNFIDHVFQLQFRFAL